MERNAKMTEKELAEILYALCAVYNETKAEELFRKLIKSITL